MMRGAQKGTRWLMLAGALVVCSKAVMAAPVSLPQSVSTGLLDTEWFVGNTAGTSGGPFSGSCDNSPAFGIEDATSANLSSDAYDFGWSGWVNDVPFVAPSVVDLTGTTMLAGPVTMSGINVFVQYYFSPTLQAGRILVWLVNPASSATAVTVKVPINFGSDNDTQVDATSSGDTTVTTTDRWVVTSDGGLGDPVNTTVFYGPGSPTSTPSAYTQTVFSCYTADGLGATFNVTVPPTSSVALMFFAGLGDIVGQGNTISGAISNAAIFDSVATLANTTDLLAGVTVGTSPGSAPILNWEGLSVPPVPLLQAARPAPASSLGGLLLLAIGLGAFGLRTIAIGLRAQSSR